MPSILIVDQFGKDQARATKILVSDGWQKRGRTPQSLDQAVDHCTAASININAWGVGTDWDAAELRHMADATHGTADIIPTPSQIEAAFTASFSEMRKIAITNARLQLWTPNGVKITQIQQVYPSIAPLGMEPDPTNPRQQIVGIGSFAPGEQHDYLLNIEMPVYPPGQQFMMARPSVRYFVGGKDEVEEKSAREGWIFVQWTEDASPCQPDRDAYRSLYQPGRTGAIYQRRPGRALALVIARRLHGCLAKLWRSASAPAMLRSLDCLIILCSAMPMARFVLISRPMPLHVKRWRSISVVPQN